MKSSGPYRSRRRLLAVAAGTTAIALLGHGNASAQHPVQSSVPSTLASDASTRFRAVAAAVMRAMAETGVPGAAVGIFHDGRTEVASFGVARLATHALVTPETRFQMGAITKTYTATAAMRLVEQGRLDLDVPVRAYLPDLELADAEVAASVTAMHLLTHTGNWFGDALLKTGDGDGAISRYVEQFLGFPQIAPLASFFNYSYAGYSLLGRIVEVVADKPYRFAIRELVGAPLGFSSTFRSASIEAAPFAEGHALGPDGLDVVAPRYLPRSADPAGGMWTTIGDQLRFGRLHLGEEVDRVRLLSDESLRAMQTTRVPMINAPDASVGLSWVLRDVSGMQTVQVNGGTFGQAAYLFLIPAHRFAMAMLTNAAGLGDAVAAIAVRESLGRYFDVGSDGIGAAAAELVSILPVERFSEYTGTYRVPSLTITIGSGGETPLFSLMATPLPDEAVSSVARQTPHDVPLTFVADDFALLGATPNATATVAFVRGNDGKVSWLSFQDRLYPRVAVG